MEEKGRISLENENKRKMGVEPNRGATTPLYYNSGVPIQKQSKFMFARRQVARCAWGKSDDFALIVLSLKKQRRRDVMMMRWGAAVDGRDRVIVCTTGRN